VEWWKEPFFQVALPVIITFVLSYLHLSKRIDDVNKRIDGIEKRLESIEKTLEKIRELLSGHDQRITRLEERTSPLARK
jgi:hypothetical protein